MSILHKHVREFRDGCDLDEAAAEVFLDGMIGERNEDLLAEVFRAWDKKGIAENEIYMIARIMRSTVYKSLNET